MNLKTEIIYFFGDVDIDAASNELNSAICGAALRKQGQEKQDEQRVTRDAAEKGFHMKRLMFVILYLLT